MIRTAALDDILRQVERYAAQNLPAIARRFAAAALTAIETAIETPATTPGVHTRPIKGFTDFSLYYQVPIGAEGRACGTTILRVLHTKRDIETIP